MSISQKTDRYSTRHSVCGLRKSRHGALLGQLPFLASPVGRPQGSKVRLLQVSQQLDAKPAYALLGLARDS